MQPTPHDLRDYLFDELDPAARDEMERYLADSAEARAELERLQLTERSLRMLPDEDPPRRIAFVSDKVFEPSRWVRLGRWFVEDGPRLAFGAAACLAVLFAGLKWTEPRVTVADGSWEIAFGPRAEVPPPAEPTLDAAELRAIVEQAVAASESRQREALLQVGVEQADRSARVWRSELDAVQADMYSGLRMVNANYERLFRSIAEFDVAEVQ